MFGGWSPGDLAPLVVLLVAALLLYPRFRRAQAGQGDRAARATRFIMLTLVLALAATFLMRWLGL
jgi:hypothetical protein